MPDSAANPVRQSVDSAAASRRADAVPDRATRLPAETDAETKLARAARSAQHLAQLSRAPYGAPTLDLFAEDAERATLQALNTDIRQSTLPGFELPEVFMAAVPAMDGDEQPASVRMGRRDSLSADRSDLQGSPGLPDSAEPRDDAATLDLMFDDVAPPDCMAAGPVQPALQDDCAGEASASVTAGGEGEPQSEGEGRSRNAKRASAARAKGAARNVAATGPAAAGAESLGTLDANANPNDAASSDSHDSPAPPSAGFPGASPKAIDRAKATAHKLPGATAVVRNQPIEMNGRDTQAATDSMAPVRAHRTPPQSLAAALIGDERRTRQDTASRHAPPSTSSGDDAKAVAELDTARATAFADTIDALYAVMADQRRASAALSRRMKTLLLIVACVLLVTVATGVAQTVALVRLTRENTAQQQRIEQLMLSQQATLESFFDTDSAIVEVPNRGSGLTRNNDPGAASQNRSAKRAHSKSP